MEIGQIKPRKSFNTMISLINNSISVLMWICPQKLFFESSFNSPLKFDVHLFCFFQLLPCFLASLVLWFVDSLIHWFVDSLPHWFIDSSMLGSLAHSLSCACILSYHFIGTSTTIFLIRCCTSQFQHFLHCLCIAKTFLQAIDVLQSRPCFETSAPAVHTNKPTTHACVRVCVCVRVRVCVCARTKKNFFSGPFLFVGCLFYPEKTGSKHVETSM